MKFPSAQPPWVQSRDHLDGVVFQSQNTAALLQLLVAKIVDLNGVATGSGRKLDDDELAGLRDIVGTQAQSLLDVAANAKEHFQRIGAIDKPTKPKAFVPPLLPKKSGLN